MPYTVRLSDRRIVGSSKTEAKAKASIRARMAGEKK
jgi:hypothetical protein